MEIAKQRLRQVARLIQKHDDRCRSISVSRFKVVYMLSFVQMDLTINLQKLCWNYEDARYDPEVDLNCVRFSFKEKDWSGGAAVFSNGRVQINSRNEEGSKIIEQRMVSRLEQNEEKNKAMRQALKKGKLC